MPQTILRPHPLARVPQPDQVSSISILSPHPVELCLLLSKGTLLSQGILSPAPPVGISDIE